jgi:hypothetical protein
MKKILQYDLHLQQVTSELPKAFYLVRLCGAIVLAAAFCCIHVSFVIIGKGETLVSISCPRFSRNEASLNMILFFIYIG